MLMLIFETYIYIFYVIIYITKRLDLPKKYMLNYSYQSFPTHDEMIRSMVNEEFSGVSEITSVIGHGC